MLRTPTTALALLLAASLLPPARAVPGAEPLSLLGGAPLLHAMPFAAPPRLDGVLDDPCWATAESAGPFFHFQTGEPSAYATRALLGLDATCLYVAFECGEAEMAKLKPAALPPDSMGVYAVDHVELFFAPDALQDTFYHFSVDIAANRHDERGDDGAWGCDWQAAVKLGAAGWTLEARIPRAALGLRDPRLSLVNFCRTRRLEPAETSAWSKTYGVFHNPGRFGRVVYGPASGVDFTAATLRQPRVGENRVAVSLAAAGAGEPRSLTLRGYAREKGVMKPFASRELRLSPGGRASASLALQVPRDCRTGLALVAEQAGRVVAFCRAAEVSLSGAEATPLRVVLGRQVAPGLQWIRRERLRGISYGIGWRPGMPEDGLQPVAGAAAVPAPLRLRGETYVRVVPAAGEQLAFDLTATAGDSPYTSSTYAVFAPDGRELLAAEVPVGTTARVRLATVGEGHYTLLINSGPACWNPFTLDVRNASWALDARGHSTYLGSPVGLHTLRDCRRAGMNVALMAAWQWGIRFGDEAGLAQWSEKLEGLCAASGQAGIRLIPYVGWGCAEADCEAAGDYTRALTRLGVRGPHPCPISRQYWERSFGRRALTVARLSRQYPGVIGVGLDPESYYFGGWYAQHLQTPEDKRRADSIYQPYGGSAEKCACNDCFFGYLAARGKSRPNLPEDGNARFDWLGQQGLLDDFCAYQQGELEKIVGGIRRQAQQINPDLCFAVLLLSIGDNWFCRGLARGLGTERLPALDFDEGTYTPGYSAAAMEAKLALYRRWGAHVLHGGTLWALKHPAADLHSLAAQMYNFAAYGDGYWVWPGSMSLWRSAPELGGYYSLSGYGEDYWRALATANTELDRRLAAPRTYRSALEQIRPRAAIPAEPPGGQKNEWARKPWYPVHLYPGTRLSFTVPAGSKTLRVRWGYRETLGERALLVCFAGQEHRLKGNVTAEQANIAEFAAPAGGGVGWIEAPADSAPDTCLGVALEGAQPFFGPGRGMTLR